mmetsp:Transcript_97182/g.274898  ORF Transcript_97182/g.274898 Transcript_97182/m.274898 type:complete len:221 (-) Transcript_97182:89-751(-)
MRGNRCRGLPRLRGLLPGHGQEARRLRRLLPGPRTALCVAAAPHPRPRAGARGRGAAGLGLRGLAAAAGAAGRAAEAESYGGPGRGVVSCFGVAAAAASLELQHRWAHRQPGASTGHLHPACCGLKERPPALKKCAQRSPHRDRPSHQCDTCHSLDSPWQTRHCSKGPTPKVQEYWMVLNRPPLLPSWAGGLSARQAPQCRGVTARTSEQTSHAVHASAA